MDSPRLSLITRHGYIAICLIVFAEAIDVPVPGAVALIAGGAAAAAGTLYGPAVVLCAVAAMLTADSLLYIFGSRMGWALLIFLCRGRCTCTVLPGARPPALVWRTCCESRVLMPLSLLVAFRPGAEQVIRSKPCRRPIYSISRLSVARRFR